MDLREIAALLAYIGRLDPRTAHTDSSTARDQIAQWHELLAEVPLTVQGWDAREAIKAHIVTSAYPILPVDVARKWDAYRRDRLQRHTDPTPAADPDNPTAWRAELLGNRRAVAAGEAAPSTHHELTAGPHPDVEARLRSVGSVIPPAARAQLAPYRPARAAREAATAARQPDALSVPCQWCHAHTGEPCRNRRTGLDGGARGNTPRAVPHPTRVDLAAATPTRHMAAPRPATVAATIATPRTGPARSTRR
ncbi:hypothetical protein [Streptomyces sp. ISL-44]|uniref:zinc finger domain-containing protein n=1 Tax=Streptomyces sp. ISL-44 TaxID=2819184 RepID=UPI002034F69F|nr:hypothetical protein [Streptomyces sp. ISL-44]